MECGASVFFSVARFRCIWGGGEGSVWPVARSTCRFNGPTFGLWPGPIGVGTNVWPVAGSKWSGDQRLACVWIQIHWGLHVAFGLCPGPDVTGVQRLACGRFQMESVCVCGGGGGGRVCPVASADGLLYSPARSLMDDTLAQSTSSMEPLKQ